MSGSVQKTVIKFSSVVGVKEEYHLGTRESPKGSELNLGASRLPDGAPGPSISSFPWAVGFVKQRWRTANSRRSPEGGLLSALQKQPKAKKKAINTIV